MSSHYESIQLAALYPDAFKVAAPDVLPGRHVTPRKPGVFIRKGPAAGSAATDAGQTGIPDTPEAPEAAEPLANAETPASPARELVVGQFGLVPPWVKSASDAKLRSTKLVNARSETVTTSNNFREAWLGARRCIVPVMAFFEDDFRSGKAVPTRIARVDGKPMGLAGLWESWTGAEGDTIISFTLLTINANSHALMSRYQQPGNEKRMPVILNEGAQDAWLNAHPEKAREFLRAYPANWLLANPVEK